MKLVVPPIDPSGIVGTAATSSIVFKRPKLGDLRFKGPIEHHLSVLKLLRRYLGSKERRQQVGRPGHGSAV
jgi:hypothetical protein